MGRQRAAVLLLALLPFLFSGCGPRASVVREPAAERALAELSAPLFRCCGDPEVRYRTYLVDMKAPNAYNDGGGNFYISLPLYRALDGEALQAVLAHELAHDRLGHLDSRRGISVFTTFAFLALNVAVPGAGLANLLVNPLVVSAYSREQEREADRRAAEYLARMGVGRESYARMLRSLQKLQAEERKKKGKGEEEPPGLFSLFSTHPALEERIRAFEAPPGGGGK